MTIYVVETIIDYCEQIGFSTDRVIAQKKANELNKNSNYREFYVTAYTLDKSNWCEFNDC